jgi:chromosome segregation ATPase
MEEASVHVKTIEKAQAPTALPVVKYETENTVTATEESRPSKTIVRETTVIEETTSQPLAEDFYPEVLELRSRNERLVQELIELRRRCSKLEKKREVHFDLPPESSGGTVPINAYEREIKALRNEIRELRDRNLVLLHEVNKVRRENIAFKSGHEGSNSPTDFQQPRGDVDPDTAYIQELKRQIQILESQSDDQKSSLRHHAYLLEVYKKKLVEATTERDMLQGKARQDTGGEKDLIKAEIRKHRSIPSMSLHPDYAGQSTPVIQDLEEKIQTQSLELSDLELELSRYQQWVASLQNYIQELEAKTKGRPEDELGGVFPRRQSSLPVTPPSPYSDLEPVGQPVIFSTKSKPHTLITPNKERGWTYIDKRISVRFLKKKKKTTTPDGESVWAEKGKSPVLPDSPDRS